MGGKDLQDLSHSSFHHPRLALDNSRDGVSPFPGNLMNSSTSLGSIWRDLGSTGAGKPSGSRSRIPDPRSCLETPRAHKIRFKIPFSLGIPSLGEAQPAPKKWEFIIQEFSAIPEFPGLSRAASFPKKSPGKQIQGILPLEAAIPEGDSNFRQGQEAPPVEFLWLLDQIKPGIGYSRDLGRD